MHVGGATSAAGSFNLVLPWLLVENAEVEKAMIRAIRQDLHRCGSSSFQKLREVLVNPAIWALFGYRLRRWLFERLPRARWVFAPFTIPLGVGLELLTHVQLAVAAKIGGGLYLPHLGCIVVGSGSTVGQNCTIAHGVTIGHRGGRNRSSHAGNPVIGDRVYVGPGAMILGPIQVGDDALIGAGAVVVESVPRCGVVAGNPARLLGLSGSFDLMEYPGLETGPVHVVVNDAGRRHVMGGLAGRLPQ